jgi:predicted DNA-binding ribbon-helix-helix protein
MSLLRSSALRKMEPTNGETTMQSTVAKRSIVVDGHKTSVSVEDIFWISLKEVAKEQAMTISNLVGSIDAKRVRGANLSSAIRVYILDRFRTRLQDLMPGANVSTLAMPVLETGGA